MKARFSITLDEDVLEELDKIRNDIPRSTYINKILKNNFSKNNWKGIKNAKPKTRKKEKTPD